MSGDKVGKLASLCDTRTERLLFGLLIALGSIIGPGVPSRMAAAYLRRCSMTPAGYWRTVSRIVHTLRAENPGLTKIPLAWTCQGSVSERIRGLVYELDLRDNLQAILYFAGVYEPDLIKFLQSELRPGDTVVDVGAHVGYHSIACARRLKQLAHGRVIAFEPASDSASKVRQHATQNDLAVEVVNVALSNAPGMGSLKADHRYPTGDAGVRSLFANGRIIELVTLLTFDEWAIANGLDKLDVIKIDVEGAESMVIQGMIGSIDRLKPRLIVVEVLESLQARAQSSVDELRAQLGALGYVSAGMVLNSNELFRPCGADPSASFGLS